MRLAEATLRQKEDITKVSSTFHDIEPQIDALRNSIVERAEIESAANTATQATIKTLITTGLVGVALTVVLFAWLIGRSIAHPVMAITATMKALAAGDKSVKVPGGDRKDEIGAMAAAVVVFKDNMIEADRLGAAQTSERAANERRQSCDGPTHAGLRYIDFGRYDLSGHRRERHEASSRCHVSGGISGSRAGVGNGIRCWTLVPGTDHGRRCGRTS